MTTAGGGGLMVGAGIHDITGPAAGRIMMGYVNLAQQTRGIHMRLRSRAFVFAPPDEKQRLVFVSADLGMIFQAVKQEVMALLQRAYPGVYEDSNVILSATHTHAGPGGYSDYKAYYLTSGGFDRANFRAITVGIFQSIKKAHKNLAAAEISVSSGELLDTSVNRSLTAYAKNPACERALYNYDTDKNMTVLRLARPDGTAVGMISWFAVHGVSLGSDNKLISGDNMGYASYLFEKAMGADYAAPEPFVAAFAQSNEGDVSPNIRGNGDGGGVDDIDSLEISGRKQYEKARQLFNRAAEPITGGVDSRLCYVDFSRVQVSGTWSDGQPRHTCSASLGLAMLAGTEDGGGVGREGESLLKRFFSRKHFEDCQGEKEVILPVGKLKLTPAILPLQVARIGQLGIVAVPFELTTMAGRRLRATVLEALQPSVDRVVIAGLSNSYAGYVTTSEEYTSQQYEGGSTHFGPWTLAAVRQESHRVASALASGVPVGPGAQPRKGSRFLLNLRPGVIFDLSLPFARIGTVHRPPEREYRRGDEVKAEFWGAHPRNNFLVQSSYLEAQRKVDGDWVAVARDWDPETRYLWDRRFLFRSLITVKWKIPADADPGVYRILHRGHRKRLLRGTRPYKVVTPEFKVV